MSRPGFFDYAERLEDLSEQGDPLERLNRVIRWEEFRGTLRAIVESRDRVKGGRPPYDHILMFKVLVLQSLYNLSDEQAEYQIKDWLSFMRFLGLKLEDNVPDAKTVWLFREQLGGRGVGELFKRLDRMVSGGGFLACSGQIIDASIIEAPKCRVFFDKKESIKRGEVSEGWSEAKKGQTDLDARWTVRGDVPFFGYKNHVNIDREYKFIRVFGVTDAAVHDSRVFKDVYDLSNCGSPVWADSAYRSQEIEDYLSRNGRESKILWKKSPNREMDGRRRNANTARAKVRSAIEHVFARQKAQMKLFIRAIGIKRATAKIGLANLVYNMIRLEFLQRHRPVAAF
jgi:IS5 family transposase